tara:strand:- start:85 stop:690 length:606 start_codon:yes stop_codon:yes gene_type:complete
MHQRVNKEVQDEGSDASKYGERIHEALELRLRDQSPLTDETRKYESLCTAIERESKDGELFVEQKMTLNKNLTPTEWFAPDAWFRSVLDVLMIHENQKKAFVLDWKTGKRRPDFTQMEIFALQVFKHYPEVDSVTSALVWLRDYKMDTQVYKREQSNEMWAKIMARINRIYESLEHDTWPPKPSGLCPWCPAKHICDYAQL